MVEQGRLTGDPRRMMVRQAIDARSHLDLLGLAQQRRKEDHRVGNRFRGRCGVLADPDFVVAKVVGHDDRLAILLQDLAQVAFRIVDGLHEHAKAHRVPFRVRNFVTVMVWQPVRCAKLE